MNFWAWGGKYIGYAAGDILYSYMGAPIGKFYEEELYNFDGKYIGEIMDGCRLIVNMGKKDNSKSATFKPCSHSATSRYCDYSGYVMYAGYEDFTL